MGYTKRQSSVEEIQEALNKRFPKKNWKVIGSKPYSKGCEIIETVKVKNKKGKWTKKKVTVAVFKKNYDCLKAVKNPNYKFKLPSEEGLKIITEPMNIGISKEYGKLKKKMMNAGNEIIELSGGIVPRLVFNKTKTKIIDIKLKEVQKNV